MKKTFLWLLAITAVCATCVAESSSQTKKRVHKQCEGGECRPRK